MTKEVVHKTVEKTHSKEDGLTGSQHASSLLSMGFGYLFERPKDEYTATLVHPDGTQTTAKGNTEADAVANAYDRNKRS